MYSDRGIYVSRNWFLIYKILKSNKSFENKILFKSNHSIINTLQWALNVEGALNITKSFEGWKLHDDVSKLLGRAHCQYNFRKAMNEGLKEFGLGISYSLPDLGI